MRGVADASSPGRCHFSRRSTVTVRSFTGSQSAIASVRSARNGAISATAARKAGSPFARSAASPPFGTT